MVYLRDDPEDVLIETSDISRFWEAYDQAQAGDPVRAFAEHYIRPGSTGLKDFVNKRVDSADHLVSAIQQYPTYYEGIRHQTASVSKQVIRIRQLLRKAKCLFPSWPLKDIYLMIGRMNCGGTVSENGILIGVEIFCRYDPLPIEELGTHYATVIRHLELLPHTVAHELVHVWKDWLLSESGRTVVEETLLEMTVTEGAADWLGEIISGGHVNPHLHEYGRSHEAELWQQFTPVMHGKDHSDWLHNGKDVLDRPADLGYFIGYRIVQAYYESQGRTPKAIREILLMDDVEQLVAESLYGRSF